jgi:hypothetical protein
VTQAEQFPRTPPSRWDDRLGGGYDCITAQMIARARREYVAKAPTPKGFASNGAPPGERPFRIDLSRHGVAARTTEIGASA